MESVRVFQPAGDTPTPGTNPFSIYETTIELSSWSHPTVTGTTDLKDAVEQCLENDKILVLKEMTAPDPIVALNPAYECHNVVCAITEIPGSAPGVESTYNVCGIAFNGKIVTFTIDTQGIVICDIA